MPAAPGRGKRPGASCHLAISQRRAPPRPACTAPLPARAHPQAADLITACSLTKRQRRGRAAYGDLDRRRAAAAAAMSDLARTIVLLSRRPDQTYYILHGGALITGLPPLRVDVLGGGPGSGGALRATQLVPASGRGKVGLHKCGLSLQARRGETSLSELVCRAWLHHAPPSSQGYHSGALSQLPCAMCAGAVAHLPPQPDPHVVTPCARPESLHPRAGTCKCNHGGRGRRRCAAGCQQGRGCGAGEARLQQLKRHARSGAPVL